MFTPGRHFKEFEDTNEVIRIRRRIDNVMDKRKTIKGRTTIYKTLQIKQKIE